MTEAVVVIPARYQSTRYPAKPLALIRGVTGEAKPLLQRTWEVGQASGLRTIIATDHEHIADLAKGFGAEVLMTPHQRNGTERSAYVAGHIGLRPEATVINLQGDACLTPPEWLDLLKDEMSGDVRADVLTIVADIKGELPHNDVVAFADIYGKAYHFERYRGGYRPDSLEGHFRHFGVYAYTVAALRDYLTCGETAPETIDGLEQLRWPRLGIPVRLVWAPHDMRLPTCEVNTPGDVPRVEAELRAWGIE